MRQCLQSHQPATVIRRPSVNWSSLNFIRSTSNKSLRANSPKKIPKAKPRRSPTYPRDTRQFPWWAVAITADGQYELTTKKRKKVKISREEFEGQLKEYGSRPVLQTINEKLRPGSGKRLHFHGDSSKSESVRPCESNGSILPISERTRCGPHAIFNVLGTSDHAETLFMRKVPQGELDSCDMRTLANRFSLNWNCSLQKISDKNYGHETWIDYL